MTEPQRKTILEQHIQRWENTKYDAEINGRVGKITENEQLQKQAEEQLAACLKALDELYAMLKELEDESAD